VAEHDAADEDEEHLGQVTQAQPVAQVPKHHEGNGVGAIPGSVQQSRAALAEPLTAGAAPHRLP